MKSLEARQEDWITTLIKPQEINQARLFTIDSRLNEEEKVRLEDNQFQKETVKKLIFAMEQHLTALSSGPTSSATIPRSASANRASRSQRNVGSAAGTRPPLSGTFGVVGRKSAAENNFSAQNQLVPAGDHTTLLPTLTTQTDSKGMHQPLSFIDLRAQSGDANSYSALTTHDVLFLKRLLFLKATLDN